MNDRVWLGGQPVSPADARVSIFDRGFLYGDSVFEVMRSYAGRVFAMGMHLDRLASSAARVGIELPCALDTLEEEVMTGLVSLGASDAKIRLMVSRGDGPLALDPTTAHAAMRVMIVSALPSQSEALYAEGVSVALVAGGALPGSAAAGAKASNYLANLLAAHEARRRGAYEAILFGPAGQLREGATSNLFIVRAGGVLTPRPEAGILEGITRAAVLEAARGCAVELRQDVLFAQDLYGADEAFLTSSLREIVPIVAADGVLIADGRPGPVSMRLHAAYRRLVAEGLFGRDRSRGPG